MPLFVLALLVAVPFSPAMMEPQSNSAIEPVTQRRDYPLYDWMPRHETVLAYHAKFKPDLVFIGDSITHRFGGEPMGPDPDHTPQTGKPYWDKYFAPLKASNLGYGWDRTENVLWRLGHGEIDGIKPKAYVILIGTNNIGLNTPEQIRDGAIAIVDMIHAKQPKAYVLLLGVLPRSASPNSPDRAQVAHVNELYAKVKRPRLTYLDIGAPFLEPDGSISDKVMFDYLHPTALGYERFAQALLPSLRRWFKHVPKS